MREDTKKKILDISLDMFRTHGLNNTKIEDVVKAAQISRASFYNYFHSKEEVFFCLIETEINTIQSEIETALEQDEDPCGKIRIYFLHMILGVREMVQLLNVQHDEIESLPPVPRKLVESSLKRSLNTIIQILSYGVKRGDFTVPNLELAAHVILSALDIFVNPFKLGSIKPQTVEEQVDRLLDVIFFGFAKTRGASTTTAKNGDNPALQQFNR